MKSAGYFFVMMMIKSQVLTKFGVYMALSLAVMILTAYAMAFWGFEILADMAGSAALIIWLVVAAIGAITAFIIRPKIWDMEFSVVLSLLLIYSLVEGFIGSVLFLGDSKIAVVIVAVIFVVSALSNGEKAMNHKGSSSHAGVVWALSAYLGVIMVVGFWVLIWGKWDVTRRRYSRKR